MLSNVQKESKQIYQLEPCMDMDGMSMDRISDMDIDKGALDPNRIIIDMVDNEVFSQPLR